MSLLFILSYISVGIQICFVTVAIAAGLYYLAEIVEEYTVLARKAISWMIVFTTIVYTLFIFFDNLPWNLVLCGLTAQIFHCAIMRSFPYVKFLSISFLGSVICLIINHILAFQYFSSIFYPFSQVMAYFTICLWLVPFALFVSLSANDNVLPTVSSQSSIDNHDVVSNYFSRKDKKLGLLSLFNYAKDTLLPSRNKKSF